MFGNPLRFALLELLHILDTFSFSLDLGFSFGLQTYSLRGAVTNMHLTYLNISDEKRVDHRYTST